MSFPILGIALFCILATALILVIYYFVLTKCCLNLQQTDPLRLRPPLITPSSPATCHILGLSPTLIRKIPTLHYTKQEGESRALFECAVCLSDFETNDPLRVLPKCGHGFHLDCIDVWLQSNANCPLCRGGISGRSRSIRYHRLLAPTSSPNDEEYVAMEMGENNRRKCRHGSMMGDERIEVRENVIRRSFSMDSVVDRSVYLATREAVREGGRNRGEWNRSRRVRRSFFSLGQGRSNSVLPVEF